MTSLAACSRVESLRVDRVFSPAPEAAAPPIPNEPTPPDSPKSIIVLSQAQAKALGLPASAVALSTDEMVAIIEYVGDLKAWSAAVLAALRYYRKDEPAKPAPNEKKNE